MIRWSHFGHRSGSAHSPQTASAGARVLWLSLASNRAVPGSAQVGSGEPARAKNHTTIAIEATTAVPTNTASTGVSLLVPGR